MIEMVEGQNGAAPIDHDHPLAVVGLQYVSSRVTNLKLERNLDRWTTANFFIRDETGKQIFKTIGKFRSIHDKKILFDEIGKPIVTLCVKLPTLHERWRCYKGGEATRPEDLLFTAKYPSIINHFTDIDIDVFLASNTKKEICDFKIKGNWKGDSCCIFIGKSGIAIANITRKICWRRFEDMYYLTVRPNIDSVFIVALLVAMDEIIHGEGI